MSGLSDNFQKGSPSFQARKPLFPLCVAIVTMTFMDFFYFRRFFQVAKCAAHFAKLHQNGQMVTLLTSKVTGQNNLGTGATPDALSHCKRSGIHVEPVVDFYKR